MRRVDHRAGRRPRARRPAIRLSFNMVLAVAFFGLAFGGPAWLWRSGLLGQYADRAQTAAASASADLGLTVREVLLSGRRHADRDTVLAATELEIGKPILQIDPDRVRARLERSPWIRQARVTRRLPDTVFIEIDERRPFALWQLDGRLSLIDDQGMVITERALHRFGSLPLIVGAAKPVRAKPVLDMLESEPDLHGRVTALIQVGGRRWDIRFDNGIDVRLPETQAAAAWHELARLDRRHALLARRISVIDLRIPGRVVVTRIDDPEAETAASGKQRR